MFNLNENMAGKIDFSKSSGHPEEELDIFDSVLWSDSEKEINIWNYDVAAKIMDALISGRITEIKPKINFALKEGYSFPEIDHLITMSDGKSIRILEALARKNLLHKKYFEKLRIDPDGSLQLIPVERCSNCGSGNIASGKLIEHFHCGHLGLERDFLNEYKYICPKCKRELKLLGTDYRNVGIQHKCLNCGNISPSPNIKWLNVNTEKIWAEDELKEQVLYSYTLNEEKKEWLQFQLKPKTTLINLLRLKGYNVQEMAQIQGRSGASYTIDILATWDDGLVKFDLGVGIISARPGEKEISLSDVFSFDNKAYDIGLRSKVIIALHKLGNEATSFAKQQHIDIMDTNHLNDLNSFADDYAKISIAEQNKAKECIQREISTTSDPIVQLSAFLVCHGYEVYPNYTLIGRSGTEHSFTIFATRNDFIVKPKLALTIATAENGKSVEIEKLVQYDAAAYDTGITNKVFVAIPCLDIHAKQFAEYQHIKVLEKQEMDVLVQGKQNDDSLLQAVSCPGCSSPIMAGQKFCGVCGFNLPEMLLT
jgi:hypothetical protein